MPDAVTAFAPGRVNLLGEHTDYNGGLCLPFAVQLGVTVSARRVEGRTVRVRAETLGEEDEMPVQGAARADGWRAYTRGVVTELVRSGVAVPGARLRIDADLPAGRGLASSAALEVAAALVLLGLVGRELARPALARLCSRVEHDWAGTRSGLLDQLACLHGRPAHALLLDMRAETVEPVAMRFAGWTFAILDSHAPRRLAESGYNERRAECEAAARALRVATLREARVADAARLPPPLERRLRHVLGENERVRAAARALEDGDGRALGRLLDASHASLRDLFEASVPEVEATVERALAAGAAGARMMGGGFGGSVLALFPPDRAPPDDALVVHAGDGARLL